MNLHVSANAEAAVNKNNSALGLEYSVHKFLTIIIFVFEDKKAYGMSHVDFCKVFKPVRELKNNTHFVKLYIKSFWYSILDFLSFLKNGDGVPLKSLFPVSAPDLCKVEVN